MILNWPEFAVKAQKFSKMNYFVRSSHPQVFYFSIEWLSKESTFDGVFSSKAEFLLVALLKIRSPTQTFSFEFWGDFQNSFFAWSPSEYSWFVQFCLRLRARFCVLIKSRLLFGLITRLILMDKEGQIIRSCRQILFLTLSHFERFN